ncbi:hypothetical protein GQ600_6031 [Phytophthora cactorum]|nr:hypothetical protein GQ600_6031 [Phytophthora cactorum]
MHSSSALWPYLTAVYRKHFVGSSKTLCTVYILSYNSNRCRDLPLTLLDPTHSQPYLPCLCGPGSAATHLKRIDLPHDPYEAMYEAAMLGSWTL